MGAKQAQELVALVLRMESASSGAEPARQIHKVSSRVSQPLDLSNRDQADDRVRHLKRWLIV